MPPLGTSSPEALEREAIRRTAGLLDDPFDAHVHLFPEGFYQALWRWFDAHAWSIQFRGDAEAVLSHLAGHGTRRLLALVFAHRPGAAAFLNRWLGELARACPDVVAVGTVLPGEPDALAITREAIDRHGLRGIKLHCHVQQVAIDDPRVMEVLTACVDLDVPAVVHAGREPSSTAYGVDTRALCSAGRTRRVLEALPRLRLVVPHIGADEFDAYLDLLRDHPGLWLDTAMSCAEYFPDRPAFAAIESHADRILYGTDFPILPYEADRELRALARGIESDRALGLILRDNAGQLWGR